MSELPEGDTDPLRRVFAPFIGLPAWFVRKGHGSFLTMEFGAPHLNIREPIKASPEASEKVRARLSHRQVTPRGDWHLWIYRCHWRVLSGIKQIAHNEASNAEIRAAAHELDGRLLTGVDVDPTKGTSTFHFEQELSIQTWPYGGGNDDQWMLYMKSGDVFTYREDGQYCLCHENQAAADWVWPPLSPR
ncbi:MAG TPA: hypothetical protein VNT30_05180 [Stellaceae bacterium]|nr:hypothetical protein [Stellaceae bacterium]